LETTSIAERLMLFRSQDVFLSAGQSLEEPTRTVCCLYCTCNQQGKFMDWTLACNLTWLAVLRNYPEHPCNCLGFTQFQRECNYKTNWNIHRH